MDQDNNERKVPPVVYLEIPKIQAMKFIKEMFRDRGYNETKEYVLFDQHHNMWEMFSETKSGEKIMAVFADCKVFGDAMEIEEFNPVDLLSDASMMQSGEKAKINPSQNAGMDFVKHIEKFAEAQKLKFVILVTDFMTPHALKHISATTGIQFTHFTYEETGVESMAKHIMQPVVFRALDEKEKKEYIKSHPRYKTELNRYSFDDALVKYYGMKLHDIVYIEDNDRQTGLVIEYGFIVEDL